MITKLFRIKCDCCGKFISDKDLRSGKAYNIMITPDSAFSTETYEAKCRDCYNPKATTWITPTQFTIIDSKVVK